MRSAFTIVIGAAMGAAAAFVASVATLMVLWKTRGWWYEPPTDEALQYFDLAKWLFLTGMFFSPVALVLGGLVGARLIRRRNGEPVRRFG